MKEVFKRIIGIGMSLIIATSSEITPVDFKNPEWLAHITSYKYVNQVGPEVIRCLKERDKDGLNNLFCDKVKNTKYLKDNLDDFFDYIDEQGGLVLKEDAVWTVPREHRTSSDRGGGRVVNFFGCKYWGDININGNKYVLWIYAYAIIKNRPEYIGIDSIYLSKSNEENLSNLQLKKIIGNKNDLKLGMGILNLNFDSLKWEDILIPNNKDISEYRYTFDELEKGASNW